MPGSVFSTKREMARRAPVFPALTARIGFAGGHEVEGDPHGGVAFRAHRLGRGLVHPDLLAGVVDAYALGPLPTVERGRDALGIADQNGLEAIDSLDGGEGGRDDDGRAVITAHRVERDGNRLHPRGFVPDLVVLACNHLAASIVAVGG